MITLSLVSGMAIAGAVPANAKNTKKCAGVEVSIIQCDAKENAKNPKDSAIWEVLLMVLNILTAGVGIAAVGGILYGSFLYTSASDKAEQTKKAIGVITNVVIGIVAYILMYGFLQFLIPGGVLN